MNDSQPENFNPSGAHQNKMGPIDNTASYGKRLLASILDSLLIGVGVAMLFKAIGLTPDQAQANDVQTVLKIMAEKIEALSGAQQFLLFIFPYLMFFMLNGYSLFHSGQTIGKRILKIAIVTLDDQRPAFVPLIVNRYLTQWMVGFLPGLGLLLRSLDVLAIFWTNKRCVHDLIAKTKVIDLSVKVAVTPNSFIA
ncbi:MAG: RDD family protein [Cellvibrio sp.]